MSETYKKLEELRGKVFSLTEVRALQTGELTRFQRMVSEKRIVFVAGAATRLDASGHYVKYVVNKTKLERLRLDITDKYFMWNTEWRDPSEVAFRQQMKTIHEDVYMEKRTISDAIDRVVDDAAARAARIAKRREEFLADNARGWRDVERQRELDDLLGRTTSQTKRQWRGVEKHVDETEDNDDGWTSK